jgi:death-on-curing family protein
MSFNYQIDIRDVFFYYVVGQCFDKYIVNVIDFDRIKKETDEIIRCYDKKYPYKHIDFDKLCSTCFGINEKNYYEPFEKVEDFLFLIFHRIAKIHAFTDGNKRTAFISVFMTSLKNNRIYYNMSKEYSKEINPVLEEIIGMDNNLLEIQGKMIFIKSFLSHFALTSNLEEEEIK